ncbi:oxidoreductase [Nguyenibacter vanlangensis]|uniref:SDR family NAD(P)-dependent oxidoreductase n=1 Tax=Nguyenibacter vanlangensis TaxID=1216886 RepID=A0A7Y7IWJ8_9PROT|nr:oxidoreductase [Nguyenibacter vanlangensis]NVN11691.1 SDR family NAD(P)-dependent oxidoreductase [Nguyenibacter vanlangensis]
MIERNAVWLITGCSSGLGRALAEQVLAAGYRLVATARRPETLGDLVAQAPDRAMALGLDVTDAAQIEAAIRQAEARFGAINVLVNNAGYGYVAALEEGEEADVRAVFETNVFGPWKVTNAVLPGMRMRGTGHVVNIGSVGGMVTFPAVGFYHMTKFALEGFSETLAKEVAPFGIGVTIVEPGAFRTEFRGASMKQSAVRLAEYADTAGKVRVNLPAAHGTQAGDPVRGARAIIKAVAAEHPPLHLVIGGDALDLIRKKIADLTRDLDMWEAVTRDTAFEGA